MALSPLSNITQPHAREKSLLVPPDGAWTIHIDPHGCTAHSCCWLCCERNSTRLRWTLRAHLGQHDRSRTPPKGACRNTRGTCGRWAVGMSISVRMSTVCLSNWDRLSGLERLQRIRIHLEYGPWAPKPYEEHKC